MSGKIGRGNFLTFSANCAILRGDMNKFMAILFGVLAASRLVGADLAERYAPLGRLIFTNFASAPFPHPLRAQGHSYQDQSFSAAEHYQDSHVALFVPKDFHAGPEVDFVVHFHGWRNSVSNALVKYRLPEQFAASHRNAILIVPQGPLNAPDSFGGRLEDADGFKRFMAEALEVLRQQGVLTYSRIGRIILSGHSGGYEVISAILAQGGLTQKISEVWLFDALYAKTERFALWFDHQPGRFIDLYTEHGGTKEETQALMAALTGNRLHYFSGDETNASADDLRNNHLVFLFSELPHDEVMQSRDTFRRFLETSILTPTGTASVRSVDIRDAPEAKDLADQARQIGNDLYPQILEVLSDGKSELPRQFDIVFREHLNRPRFLDRGQVVEGYACRQTVFLDAGWFCDHPDTLENVLVHEMAHVAQDYPRFAYRHLWQWGAHYLAFTAAHPFRPYPPAAPTYWTEGIADYVAAKLSGHTHFPDCPQCNDHFSTYKNGYGCAASFLLYMDSAYGSNVTWRLNAALRNGTYSDQFFTSSTGKTLDELWRDFQQTRSYTAIAADYNELDQALGYANGEPPKDLYLRLDKYLARHPDIQSCLTAVDMWRETPPKMVPDVIKYFLWIRQLPNGEQTLLETKAALDELHQALGYVGGKPPEDFRPRLRAYLEAHPDIKEFGAVRGWLDGKPSPKIQGWIESVILGRIEPGGKRTKDAAEFLHQMKMQGKLPGWREFDHGSITLKTQPTGTENYPVYCSFACRKTGRKQIEVYIVVKESPDSDWELKRAWEANLKGRFVREIPVAIED
jgi:hypothetical protein